MADVLATLVNLQQYSLVRLKEIACEHGVSPSGNKPGIIARHHERTSTQLGPGATVHKVDQAAALTCPQLLQAYKGRQVGFDMEDYSHQQN